MDERRRGAAHSRWRRTFREDGSPQDRLKDPTNTEAPVAKPPIILLKPQRKLLTDEDEEWPTVGKSVTGGKGQQQTPQQQAPAAQSRRIDSPDQQQQIDSSSLSNRRNESEPNYIYKIKKATYQTGSSYQQATKTEVVSHYTKVDAAPARPLKGGIRLITESMEWCEAPLEYLTDQPNFLVIGIIGPQGSGKSTLLSMIGGNDPFDMYRQYIFRPASKECTETVSHQTQGVQFYVTENRTILLDSQAIMSPSVMNLLMSSDRRYSYDFNTLENYVEVESIQIVSFLMQVCHVIVVLVDYFVDINLLNFIRTCEMLKASLPLSENPTGTEHNPHIVFVLNRAKKEDFTIECVRRSCGIIETALHGSNMHLTDGVSMKYSSYPSYKSMKDCAANFFVLPEMKPRGYKPEAHSTYKGVPDYEILVRHLRDQLSSLPRPPFSPPLVGGEKAWLHYAARLWDLTRKSLIIGELGRMMF